MKRIAIVLLLALASGAMAYAAPISDDLAAGQPSAWVAGKLNVKVDNAQGVPLAIVAAIQKVYNPTIKNPTFNSNAQLALMQKEAAKFDVAWAAIQQRKTDVANAIATAKNADAAGARAALEGVLSPPPDGWPTADISSVQFTLDMGHKFNPRFLDNSISHQLFLLPIDTEYAAAAELAAVAARDADLATAAKACYAETTRRRVLAEPDERLLWLARSPVYRDLVQAAHKDPVVLDAVTQIKSYYEQRTLGTLDAVAHGCFRQALDDAHVSKHAVGDLKTAKVGDWIAVAFTPTKWVDAGPVYAEHRSGFTAYDCHDTNHLTAITPSGRFVYEQQCKFKPFQVNVDMTATLTTPPAQRPAGEISLVAEVAKVGAKVQLTKAQLIPAFFDRDVRAPVPR
jgi:hypothetical protein